jgi:cytochrome P450
MDADGEGEAMTITRAPARAAIPGPVGHPLFGMVPALRRDVLGTLLDGFQRYGDMVAYRLGARWPAWLGRTAIAVHDPDGVHQVFTGGKVFGRRTPAFLVLGEVMGTNLLTADGDVWLRRRRTLQPLFTPRRVAGYIDLMTAEAERIVSESPIAPGAEVDLHDLMQRYTLRVVGRALFGDEVDDEIAELQPLIPLTGDLITARTLQPIREPMSWPTPRNRRLVAGRAAFYGVVDRILARRAARAGGGEGDDLVARLAAARDPETGAALSAQDIRDEALVFLLAGHETTAGALTFTLDQLGRHPDIQDRVAESGDELCRAAVMEGMRLYPPAYATERLVEADTEICGYHVPAGTFTLVSAWVTHRHPRWWPDPERFDPDRFVGEHDRPRYAYFPFGGGPRSCIGEHFALLEATVLLRTLLTRYTIKAVRPGIKLMPLVTLRPAEPVLARLTPR